MTIGITSHEAGVVFLAARPNDHERYKKCKKTRNATKLHKCCKRTNYVIYYIHFEINGVPCNLIGSQEYDFSTNRTAIRAEIALL
jgi:hypothetical protein